MSRYTFRFQASTGDCWNVYLISILIKIYVSIYIWLHLVHKTPFMLEEKSLQVVPFIMLNLHKHTYKIFIYTRTKVHLHMDAYAEKKKAELFRIYPSQVEKDEWSWIMERKQTIAKLTKNIFLFFFWQPLICCFIECYKTESTYNKWN